ncbi:hypothetical protein HanIR_Chr11g0519931 [Helianthus annuus]|nr:hypothetical protein HanIR_Chr11g0519931 [Helianthus annuus]
MDMRKDTKILRAMMKRGMLMGVMVIKENSVMCKVNLKGWQVSVECHNNNNNNSYHNTLGRDHKGHQCNILSHCNKFGHKMYNHNFNDQFNTHRCHNNNFNNHSHHKGIYQDQWVLFVQGVDWMYQEGILGNMHGELKRIFRPIITQNPSPVVIPHNNQGRTFEVENKLFAKFAEIQGASNGGAVFPLRGL